jgi:hypothetical protein
MPWNARILGLFGAQPSMPRYAGTMVSLRL